MRPLYVSTLLLLIACDNTTIEPGIPGTTVTDPLPTTSVTLPCVASVDSVSPQPGGVAGVNDPVVVSLTDAVDANQIPLLSLYESDTQAPVSTTVELSTDGMTVTFTADAPLAYDTEYTMDLSVCDTNVSGTFITLPEPINGDDIVNRTYVLPFADLVWTEPSNSTLLESMIGIDALLVQVLGHDASLAELDAVAATGMYDAAGIIPDCPAATETPPADFSNNPYFQISAPVFYIPSGGTLIELENLELWGEFNTDASSIMNAGLSGQIDPAAFLDGLDCNTAAILLSGTCVPCNYTSGDCLVIMAEAPEAPWDPALDLVSECGL